MLLQITKRRYILGYFVASRIFCRISSSNVFGQPPSENSVRNGTVIKQQAIFYYETFQFSSQIVSLDFSEVSSLSKTHRLMMNCASLLV